MRLTEEERKIVVRFRLDKSKKTFTEVSILIDNAFWQTAANRLYYACYYAVSALLVENGIETQTHNGVINQLGLHFVRKGLLSAENGKFYKQIFELRQTGDYSDWINIEEDDIKPLIEKAKNFIHTIEQLILNKTTE
ncbi:MAG: HEPN domain-containing protein [Prevotellaceae bacterium]|jgi:uncharacterized protein (UPF0332 family)|nr:HEPN domain-containing protein [Prevotellaceae bacterium]